MVFQDSLSALNPVFTVGTQIAEMLRVHRGMTKRDAEKRAVEMLDLVGIPAARQRVRDYPHQFSGGMRQRVMIAMALALDPDVLIADEPTTALDVTVQAQILDLIARAAGRAATWALILITHDLGVVADVGRPSSSCTPGRIVERGRVDDALRATRCIRTPGRSSARSRASTRGQELHDDPRAAAVASPDPVRLPVPAAVPDARSTSARRTSCPPLLTVAPGAWSPRAVPPRSWSRRRPSDAPMLVVKDLVKHFPISPARFKRTVGHVRAVDGVSLRPAQGRDARHRRRVRLREVDAGRLLMRPGEADGGRDLVHGDEIISDCAAGSCAGAPRNVQIVFQDPYSSLNPRMTGRRHRRRAARGPPGRRAGATGSAGPASCSTWSG